jgi:arabinose-5-phosphate isomerase
MYRNQNHSNERNMNKNTTQKDLEHAKRVLSIEVAGLNKLSQSLNETLTNALDVLQNITGRVIVTGMGKSGHVAI